MVDKRKMVNVSKERCIDCGQLVGEAAMATRELTTMVGTGDPLFCAKCCCPMQDPAVVDMELWAERPAFIPSAYQLHLLYRSVFLYYPCRNDGKTLLEDVE